MVYIVHKCRHSGVLLESTKIENNKIASREGRKERERKKRNHRNTNIHSEKITHINKFYLDLLEKSKRKLYFSQRDVEKHEIFI